MYEKLIGFMKSKGWEFIPADEEIKLPDEITARYNIPEDWLGFVSKYKSIINSNGDMWFLTPADYYPKNNETSAGYEWNEFEKISLEAVGDDEDEVKRIKSFWDKHLPIIMYVGGEYLYCAANTENGRIVYCYEPEFEIEPGYYDGFTLADSFEEFAEKIISGETDLDHIG